MNKTVYPISAFSILLIIPPAVMLFAGWHWQPSESTESLKWLYWLTETAGLPYSLITSAVLLVLALAICQPTKANIIKWMIVIICCILVGQGIKGVVKNTFQEPRPYVVWLEENYDISSSDFYELKRKQRVDVIKEVVKRDQQVPSWQRKHWQAETGYSFPSGHVLFAAGWALLLIGLFWQRRQYALAIVIAVWAEGIVFSRLLLGMHWPSDVIVSIIISAVLAMVACRLLQTQIRITSKE
ncbi:phosphatidylglycerophosphatase B [Providencia stuartii]|uniref:phosphatidylglycerophosphatase B n=1 Tax=Providencia TaxID=586 RepID=UPI0027FE9D47|nr:phosphatidylglycerophosphatase B [Providencia sp. 2023EL-00965]ELR5298559.1 phosphatidylglycerophosphatase B [Providencia stuartii]MDW7587006.1 phosphatidylglycerophosphatase B [Providencia sp. 2023EL-00965]